MTEIIPWYPEVMSRWSYSPDFSLRLITHTPAPPPCLALIGLRHQEVSLKRLYKRTISSKSHYVHQWPPGAGVNAHTRAHKHTHKHTGTVRKERKVIISCWWFDGSLDTLRPQENILTALGPLCVHERAWACVSVHARALRLERWR